MEPNRALSFLAVTEEAAVAAARWVGRGDKEAADGAAVDAMRAVWETLTIDGHIVIGEGEMDEAPMLYIGERVGLGTGMAVDIAVDPLEGTTAAAQGIAGAMAVIAVAPQGSLLHAPDMYMEKIMAGPGGRDVIALDQPIEDNLLGLAEVKGCRVKDLTVAVINRPRHQDIIDRMYRLGARVKLIENGDVAPAVATALPNGEVDLVVGTGGAPEGVLAAAALRCLGGSMQARLIPEDTEEYERVQRMGIADPHKLLTMEDLVAGDDVVYIATAITDVDLLDGIRIHDNVMVTSSLVLESSSRLVRMVRTEHPLPR